MADEMEPEDTQMKLLKVYEYFEKVVLASSQGKQWYEITAKEWGKATDDQLQHVIKGVMLVLQRIAQSPAELAALKPEELGKRTMDAVNSVTNFTLALDYLMHTRTAEKKSKEALVAYG